MKYHDSKNCFQIVLMGKVGKNNLGDIAIDDISLTPGSCPSKWYFLYFFFNSSKIL